MTKNYTSQLGEWVKQAKVAQRDKNLVAFLTVRDDVRAAVQAGFAVKTIWRNLSDAGRIAFSYDAFRGYVARMVDQPAAVGEATTAKAMAPAPKVVSPKPEATGFTFNPVPNKEELL